MQPGLKIPVELPREIVRGEVIEVRSEDEVVVGLTVQEPLARTHSFHFGDKVVCRREFGIGGAPKWRAVANG